MKERPDGTFRRAVVCCMGLGQSVGQLPIGEKKKALASASAFLELLSRFELLTSSLPMTRSTI